METRTTLMFVCVLVAVVSSLPAPPQPHAQSELEELKSKLGHLKSVLEQLSVVIDESEKAKDSSSDDKKLEERTNKAVESHEEDSSEEDSSDDESELTASLEKSLLQQLTTEDQAILEKLKHKVQYIDDLKNKHNAAAAETDEGEDEEKRTVEDTASKLLSTLSDEDKILLMKLNSKIKYVDAMKEADKLKSHENEDDEVYEDEAGNEDLEEALSSLHDKSLQSRSIEETELAAAQKRISELELAVEVYRERLADTDHPIREVTSEGIFGSFPDVPVHKREQRDFIGSWEDKALDDEKLGSESSKDLEEASSRLLSGIAYAKAHHISIDNLIAALDAQHKVKREVAMETINEMELEKLNNNRRKRLADAETKVLFM